MFKRSRIHFLVSLVFGCLVLCSCQSEEEKKAIKQLQAEKHLALTINQLSPAELNKTCDHLKDIKDVELRQDVAAKCIRRGSIKSSKPLSW